jgi:GDP-mannose pyrophosphatase NudK
VISDVKITNTEILSDFKYLLKKVTYEYVKKDGSKKTQIREVYDRGDAAAILLYNKAQKTVVLTSQFRLPTFMNGNETGLLIETCAGLLDDDSPEVCAKREAEEETGYKIKAAIKVFEAYSSSGVVTEKIYFFIAEYDKQMKVSEGGGVEGEEENIDVLEKDINEALAMIDEGKIQDAKTIMLLQHVRLKGIL